MELAKIRNKAQNDAEKASQDTLTSSATEVAQPPALTLPEDLFEGVVTDVAFPGPSIKRPNPVQVCFDPLKLIVAGRESDQANRQQQVVPIAEDLIHKENNEVYAEFLCFRLGLEEYGINIMEIKEIIKPRELTEVPRTPGFIDGVLSLRGVIVPVINMGKRLALSLDRKNPHERIVIVKNAETLTGLRVDEVTGVVRIFDSFMESTPAALDGIDREYVAGIGRTKDRMVILLDVQTVANVVVVAGS